ncbi:MAG: hypothetical protein ACUZ8H_03100 [Candidatus Anammoxibacter sp.]
MKPDLSVLLIRNSFDQRTGEFDDNKPVDSSMKYLPKPIGLLYLKAALENRSVPCEVLDLDAVRSQAEITSLSSDIC